MNENDFCRLEKGALGCMRLSAALGAGAMLLILAAARLILHFCEVALPPYVDWLLLAWAALWIAYIFISPAIRYRRYRYLVDEDKIIVREGLWFISTELAPIERVHQIAVKSGPIDRKYGLAQVIATTAGGTITIRFLRAELAAEIAASLQVKVRHILRQQGVSLELPAVGAAADAAAQPLNSEDMRDE
ncbi:MAG: PH domain-containing protein [Bacillota bacterium]|nr:PH domain-containing protein [Bacillota bacterium]